ncbi:ABC transporter substrate-binding protein [Bradyrhizobium sp.]|uniref:ABC transporter substrate-binding protein n=1 Tax=Bradyrhizobium sp. TaxID=376 RepID=UPI003C78E071
MRRREFITLAGGAAAWPLAARAQQAGRVRRIGLLMTMAETEPEAQARLTSFRAGLQQLGWTEGHNIKIDYRFAAGDPDRLRSSAMELVRLAPDAILANGTAILSALKRETQNIPIVFVLVPDPVGDGFVDSLARPGGNVTGLTNFEFPMGGKWVELLKEIAPRLSQVALVFNPETAPYARKFLQSVAQGAEATLLPVRSDAEIERAAETVASNSNSGLIILPDLFTSGHRELIVAQAERYRLPAIYPFRFFARSGGLLSYGVDTLDLFRRSASFVDRILKGEKPSDLPVEAPIKFELVINLKTARALGLDVPLQLQQRADEVIE